MNYEDKLPLVSCIMPTFDRRDFIPHAIRYFLRQQYEHKELIIIDDGTDAVEDLVPKVPAIRYYRLPQKISLGAKLNLACGYAKGNIIVHWDDDDWYAPRRIRYQVDTLLQMGAAVCGINHLYYYDLCHQRAYQYIYPSHERAWLLGSSLCYTKELWNRNPFADINVGMDALFVWGTPPELVTALSDPTIAVHMIHEHNVSPKKTDGGWWHPFQVEEIQRIVDGDWTYYANKDLKINGNKDHVPEVQPVSTKKQCPPVRNVYICLVHEHEDCVIDLVRNLYYHDPGSTILLYDGGENSRLLQNHFPYENFNAVLFPNPFPVKHGYLHAFALACMQFALEHFSFDVLTFVDSDQLAIRSGYSEYLSTLIASTPNIGMLSSRPIRLTPEDTTDNDVWPIIQAFKEYELWKPLLQSFPGGEDQFVHWTFWPSTVFTVSAARDLVQFFTTNEQLHAILEQTKIWATEEVILPTIVKLLGYNIVSNPCSFQFVKYRKHFSLKDLEDALNKSDVYWIHPIERCYENTNRKYIREYFNHYANQITEEACKDDGSESLLLTIPLLNRIKQIEGWLEDQEADLLIATTLKACRDPSVVHNIVEVGSYHGKSTVLFGSVVKAYVPDAKLFSIDTHDGNLGAVDQGLISFPPSFDAFKKNINEAGLSELVAIIQDHSCNVEWQEPISLLFIDGLHDYPNVSKDFWHFSKWVRPGGYVAFHDYADYYPGVKAFVHDVLRIGTYRKVEKAESLIVLQKLEVS